MSVCCACRPTRRNLRGSAPKPIENVWEYLRGNLLSMSVWDTYEQIVDACCNAWNAFIQDTARVVSITSREWATVMN